MKSNIVIFGIDSDSHRLNSIAVNSSSVMAYDAFAATIAENAKGNIVALDSLGESIDFLNVEEGKIYYVDYDDIRELCSKPSTMRMLRSVGFRLCDECGRLICPSEIADGSSVWHGDIGQRYCRDCEHRYQLRQAEERARQNMTPRVRIGGYHEHDDRYIVINGEGEHFDMSNVLGIGIEMEANGRDCHRHLENGRMECTREFAAVANVNSGNCLFHVERDATVAVEIISNVFTKKALKVFDWSILTNQLRLIGNDESVYSVGFHVHLTKGFLGSTPKEQALNLLKVQYFMLSYREDFRKISGRKEDDFRWCSFMTARQIERVKEYLESLPDDATAYGVWRPFEIGHGSDGCALISSGKTVELRIGHSTNDPERIKHYLELVVELFCNIKNVPFGKCYCMNKVFKTVSKETMAYWRSKGLFLRTNAANVRGVSVRA